MLENDMNIVIVGHVDHGKSTVIGRLLAETKSLPNGKLEQVKALCERNSKPFEYAFLLDALKDEQSQGITIDSARVFFKTEKRKYIIIDSPGHIEFVKNMVTGASRAEAALLVIDASEGIKENTKRHGYILSLLGINQICVIVNKMDLVDYSEEVFEKIKTDFKIFLKSIDIKSYSFIPVSGIKGDLIVEKSANMQWYAGDTVLSMLDSFNNPPLPVDKPLRLPVQDIYKFTKNNDNRRITVGKIETGSISIGDEIVFYPSGKKNIVKSIEEFNSPLMETKTAGHCVGITLMEEIYIKRGDLIAKISESPPKISSTVKVNIFWLGNNPMLKEKKYVLKIGTQRVIAELVKINRIINTSDLSSNEKQVIEKYDAANCVLHFNQPIAFDTASQITETSRFVVVDGYDISGGGIILKDINEKHSWIQDKVINRNIKWEKGNINRIKRSEKFNQRSILLILTGGVGAKQTIKKLARSLEKDLFSRGKLAYYLGMKNVLYGVDADIVDSKNEGVKDEHIRRLAEISNIMLDFGSILIVTAVVLTNYELNIIKTSVGYENVMVFWIGDDIPKNIDDYNQIKDVESVKSSIEYIREILYEKGIIFKAW